jgi:transcriptional regulator
MYVPSSFSQTDPQTLYEFIGRHSFAVLVSSTGTEPFASHLPLLLERPGAGPGRLTGHMARANPQWRTAAGRRVLAVFHGPHAYISPSWYQASNVVPTWNYLAVHVSGTFRVQEDPAWLRSQLQGMIRLYEASQPAPWSLDAQDSAFIDQLLRSIVGFTIDVERIEGKWKLNQNHPPQRRRLVVDALRQRGDAESLAIAEWMATLNEGVE